MIKSIFDDSKVEEIEEGILSCISPDERSSGYDRKVKTYDLVVGNAFYNRLVWGNWPSNYAEFCRQALGSTQGGIFLDAGCGSLVFTAKAYAEATNDLVVLLDRSLGMLRAGRTRIKNLCGLIPANVVFVQGDIFHLPFRDGVFSTVASFGVLHIFTERMKLLSELGRVKSSFGKLYVSSLVGDEGIGRKYLELLRRAGEVADCYSSKSLGDELTLLSPYKFDLETIGNMAYFKSA